MHQLPVRNVIIMYYKRVLIKILKKKSKKVSLPLSSLLVQSFLSSSSLFCSFPTTAETALVPTVRPEWSTRSCLGYARGLSSKQGRDRRGPEVWRRGACLAHTRAQGCWVRWHTPATQALKEAAARGSRDWAWPEQLSKTFKIKKKEKPGGVHQCEALGTIPRTTKERKYKLYKDNPYNRLILWSSSLQIFWL